MASSFFPETLTRSPRRSSRTCCPPSAWTAASSSAMAKQQQGSSSLAPSLPTATFKEELLCPICYEPFKDAVTLCCGHNFCKGCVSRSWEGQPRRHVCPVCKALCAPEDLRTNHTLANIVEMFLKQEKQQQQRAGEAASAALCAVHREEAKLFCLEDKELVCFVCQSSKQHRDHKLRPVAEMAKDCRAKCKDMENSLRDKMQEFGRAQSNYRIIADHNKAESGRLEKEIRKQFEQLHEFLQSEEKTLLEELRDEAQKKQDLIEGKIKKLSDENQLLLQEVRQLQADLKEGDLSFLQKHKNRKRRIAWTVGEPEAIPTGMLIEVTRYLDSLQYNMWKKMLDTIKVVPFSFDPNTAAGWLAVSDDLTSVAACDYKLLVDVPERTSSAGMPCVLGSKSFSRGSHSWEVEVGTDNWYLGVARKRCSYQWSLGCDARLGFGYMYRTQGAWKQKGQFSKSVLPENGRVKGLKRVRVELDCDEGELSFYDAERKSHIYTFHDKFGEVVPYFCICSTDVVDPEPLKICPLQVRIKADYPD